MSKGNFDYKYIFGPVPSRRLGFSLGIDVIPFKTCSYDCIYCQLGRTTNKTMNRDEFTSVAEIITELEYRLNEDIEFDFITLSGSGEPTLYSKLNELILRIKQLTEKPVAVLTNGSLLWDKHVQDDLKNADLIIPSLDAGNKNIFRYVNRPCEDLNFTKVVDGIIEFGVRYRKKIWLEVFLLNGVTSIQSEILQINSIIKEINPARIQINTVKRPPAESFALSVPDDLLLNLSGYFDGNVEVISCFSRQTDKKYMEVAKNDIINLVKRRPCSLDDIAGGLHLHKNEILKYIEELIKSENIITCNYNHVLYYSIK